MLVENSWLWGDVSISGLLEKRERERSGRCRYLPHAAAGISMEWILANLSCYWCSAPLFEPLDFGETETLLLSIEGRWIMKRDLSCSDAHSPLSLSLLLSARLCTVVQNGLNPPKISSPKLISPEYRGLSTM